MKLLSERCQSHNGCLTESNIGSGVYCVGRITAPTSPWTPRRSQRSALRKQHRQLCDVYSAYESNIDPEESSDAPFNPVDNTEDAKTQRDFDESKADDVMGLRSYTPLYGGISSTRTETFDVLSKTCVDPFGGDKGPREADDLYRSINSSLWLSSS